AGEEGGRRVDRPEAVGLLGPAERGEGPEPRREPRVEDVLVLHHPRRRLLDRDDEAAALVDLALGGGVVPDGDAVAPPELAADGPVADVLEPAEVLVGPPLGVEPDLAVADDLHRALGQRLHADVPLQREERLDDGLASAGDGDGRLVLLHLDRKSTRLNSSHVKNSYAVFCLKKKNNAA